MHSCDLLVADLVGCTVQDKIVCYICIDLHVMYVFLYLYVMDLKLESGYDMCYIFSHCIYFFIYL